MTKPRLPFLMQMRGNRNAYAIQKEDGTYLPIRQPLTPAVLKQHLAGDITVGTYVNDGDKAKFLCFDIDDDDLNLVEGISSALQDVGFDSRYIGVEFSGRKGHHIWVVFKTYVLAADLRRVGKAVLSLSGVKCEVFPKQDVARDLGNLVKLPGGKHRVTGQPNNFRGPLPATCPASVLTAAVEGLPEAPKVSAYEGGSNPYECLETIQSGIEAGDRNNALFHLAVMLRKNGLNNDNTETVVRDTAEKCVPPYGQDEDEERELDGLLESSKRSGPLCNQLDDDIRCTDCPFYRTGKGLFTKAGQLRYGKTGQRVVVEIAKRSGNTVRLRHPDTTEVKGVLHE